MESMVGTCKGSMSEASGLNLSYNDSESDGDTSSSLSDSVISADSYPRTSLQARR